MPARAGMRLSVYGLQLGILLKYSFFQCVIHLWFCTIYLVIIIIIKACM